MMIRVAQSAMAGTFLILCGAAHAQDLDREIATLSGRLGASLVSAGTRAAAAIDFTDLQSRPTELGRYLAERVSVELVAVRGLTVIDRANIKNILAEHRLSEEGLISAANAKKLGEFAGVDALVTGTVTVLGERVNVTLKAISTVTAQVIAAGQANFAMTPDLRQLQYAAVSRPGDRGPVRDGAGAPAREESVAPIADRDIGSLRVLLRSVSRLSSGGASGVRYTFDLYSREASRDIVVAVNGEPGPATAEGRAELRASVLDDAGARATLVTGGLVGIAQVRGGVRGPRGEERYQPGEIDKLLSLRDRLGREVDHPADVSPYQCGEGGCNYVYGRPQVMHQNRNRFVSGNTTIIAPGETVRVTMDFLGVAGRTAPPPMLQFSAELVIGVVASPTSTRYSVRSLALERVRLPEQ